MPWLLGIANRRCKELPITIARHCQLPNQVFTRKAVFQCLKGPTSQVTCLELLSLIHRTGNRLPWDQLVTLLSWTPHSDGTPQLDTVNFSPPLGSITTKSDIWCLVLLLNMFQAFFH